MFRRFHSLVGLLAALLIAVLAITGTILAIEPVRERAAVVVPATGQLNVANVAQSIMTRHPQVERITRTASGSIIVHTLRDGQPITQRVDPTTGRAVAAHHVSSFTQTVTELHRSLLLGDGGRIAAGLGALAMVVLAMSGLTMLARRLGGWAALLKPIKGTGTQRFHSALARLALLPLMLSALTGCYMSLATLGLISDGQSGEPPPTLQSSPGKSMAVGKVSALSSIDLSDLRELTFPRLQDANDVYGIRTSQGVGQIDVVSGLALTYEPHGIARRVYETAYMLHSGQGLWPLAIIVGVAALTVPLIAGTGILIWWSRQRARPSIKQNAKAKTADSIILVGSEGNSTWGFARALHDAMTKAGHRVHTAPMNSFGAQYKSAKRLIILSATYGDGVAPASANGFLHRLKRSQNNLPVAVAVVGFGDRGFPHFCRFADDVASAVQAKNWPALVPTARVNRQSVQEFSRWSAAFGTAIGTPLTLGPINTVPTTTTFALYERADYGDDVQAPTSVLRFVPQPDKNTSSAKSARASALPSYEAGDLIGVVPPGSDAPRFYSLASSTADGVLEFCVRKQPGGLCSSFIHQLELGATIEAFVRPNPAFRPNNAMLPLLLIGAGTGIGPLAGFIRHNKRRRPVHLYWGGRHPSSDFLYQQELAYYLSDERLTRCRTAFSRIDGGFYVQDRLAAESSVVRDLVRRGAQVMVCGGREMATDVAEVITAAIKPLGIDLSQLKSEGRYLEDVY